MSEKNGLFRLFDQSDGEVVGPFESINELLEYVKSEPEWNLKTTIIQKREYAPWTTLMNLSEVYAEESPLLNEEIELGGWNDELLMSINKFIDHQLAEFNNEHGVEDSTKIKVRIEIA